MQQNPPFWYSKTYIVATLTLLLLIGLSEAGTVLGVPKLQRDQHALEAGSIAFQPERIRQNLRVTHSSSNLGVAVAAATQESNPAKVDARSSRSRRGLAGEPSSSDGATEVPIGVLAHFSSWLDKPQSLPARAATARVTPAAVATTSSSSARQRIALHSSAAEETAGYQPVRTQAQTWFQQLLQDLDGDLERQDEQLSKLHKRGRAKQPEEAEKPPKHGPAWGEDENERLVQDRDHDREPSMQYHDQQGTHHGDHYVFDDQRQHQRDLVMKHGHDYHDVHCGEGPPHSEDVYPGQKQLDEPTPPWKDDHPEQRQAAGRHDGMHLGPDKQPDQAPEEQHTSRPPVHMPGPKASDRPKYVPDDRPRYAPKNRPGYAARRWVPSRAPSSSLFVPPMAQQYRPPVGNHAANGWAQGPGDGYSSWPETACFQEVTRSDCRTTGSGAVGSPVQLLGYRSTLGCCQGPVPQGGPELTFYPGLTSYIHSTRRPAGSAVMPMHSPAAAQKPSVDKSSGHPQESAAAAAATVASTHTTAAATAVPSQDAWSGSYGGYGPNIPGADNAASCVWDITQMEVQPAESSFFAQKIANATGICRFY